MYDYIKSFGRQGGLVRIYSVIFCVISYSMQALGAYDNPLFVNNDDDSKDSRSDRPGSSLTSAFSSKTQKPSMALLCF